MGTELPFMVDETVLDSMPDEPRALGVIRRLLLGGFIAVILLEAWLAWELYRSLL